MGTYYIPNNNLKGENRILLIFSTKALIYTAALGLVGFAFYKLFTAIGQGLLGWIFLGAFGLLGFGIGTFKFPSNGNSKMSRYWGGEQVDEIAIKYYSFKKNKKIYSYAIPRENPTYEKASTQVLDLFNLQGKTETEGSVVDNMVNKNDTKEER